MSELAESLIDFNIHKITMELKELIDELRANIIDDLSPNDFYKHLYDDIKKLTEVREKLYETKYSLQE